MNPMVVVYATQATKRTTVLELVIPVLRTLQAHMGYAPATLDTLRTIKQGNAIGFNAHQTPMNFTELVPAITDLPKTTRQDSVIPVLRTLLVPMVPAYATLDTQKIIKLGSATNYSVHPILTSHIVHALATTDTKRTTLQVKVKPARQIRTVHMEVVYVIQGTQKITTQVLAIKLFAQLTPMSHTAHVYVMMVTRKTTRLVSASHAHPILMVHMGLACVIQDTPKTIHQDSVNQLIRGPLNQTYIIRQIIHSGSPSTLSQSSSIRISSVSLSITSL